MFDFEYFFESFKLDPPLIIAVIVCASALVALITAIVVAHFVTKKKNGGTTSSRSLAFGAVCIALSFALSFIGVSLPFGGTITLVSTLPIMIYCYYFGFVKSIAVCTANMLLQMIQGYSSATAASGINITGYILCAVLDYILAYMALIFFGIFSYKKKAAPVDANGNPIKLSRPKMFFKDHSKFLIAGACYVVVRYMLHVLSGVIVFNQWAWEGWNVWPYSLTYNSYIFLDTVVALVAGCACISSKAFNRLMISPVTATPQTAYAATGTEQSGAPNLVSGEPQEKTDNDSADNNSKIAASGLDGNGGDTV